VETRQPILPYCLSNERGILDLCVQPFIQYGMSDIFARNCNFKHGDIFFLNFYSLKNVAKIKIWFPIDFSHLGNVLFQYLSLLENLVFKGIRGIKSDLTWKKKNKLICQISDKPASHADQKVFARFCLPYIQLHTTYDSLPIQATYCTTISI